MMTVILQAYSRRILLPTHEAEEEEEEKSDERERKRECVVLLSIVFTAVEVSHRRAFSFNSFFH
jgi:hypothetical protein